MTATVYTNIAGLQYQRIYPLTQVEFNSVLAASGTVFVSYSTLASTLANYLLTASLSSGIAAQYTHVIATPTASAIVTMQFSLFQSTYVLAPTASSLSSLIVILPASPYNGAVARVTSTKVIGSFELTSSDSSTVVEGPVALIAGQTFAMLYNSGTNSWYPTT